MNGNDDAAKSANLSEQELANLQSIELDLGPGGPDLAAAPGLATPDLGAPPSAPTPGADPFAQSPEPYAAPMAQAVPAPKPSVREIAQRVAEGGARAAAHLSPMLADARAKTAQGTARAVDQAKARGLVPLAAIFVGVGVLVVGVFAVALLFMRDSAPTAPGSDEPRTKHVSESAGAKHE
ncbi:MAG: hypothetical protein U0183_08705 [Polyangiaceae bacterium]